MRYGSWRWMVAALLAFGLSSGCGRDAAEAPASPEAAPTVVERPSLKGLCVVGNEVQTFIPCGSKKVYWIQADQESLDAFQVAIAEFTDEPYEPFAAEIYGRLSDQAGDGFAADYDGRVFVEGVVEVAPASELDCDG